MISRKKLLEAIELLRQDGRPVRIILFGSRARRDSRKDSDIDLMVVEKRVNDRDREMVRLQDLLRPLRLNADLVVVSEKNFKEWSDTPGNLIYHAAREGEVLYEMEGTGWKAY